MTRVSDRAVRHQASRPTGAGLLAANPSSRTDQRLDTDHRPAPPGAMVTSGRDATTRALPGVSVPAAHLCPYCREKVAKPAYRGFCSDGCRDLYDDLTWGNE